MTHLEYVAQNAKGFEGDTHIYAELEKLCQKFKVALIIETGTYRGATTKHLSKLAKDVITIEVKEENFKIARAELETFENVTALHGNSAVLMPQLLLVPEDGEATEGNILFFLDAHWEEFNPLLDELEAIAKAGLQPVIFIHDFKVPGRPDLGFDSYAGQDYDWAWIEAAIEKIYGAGKYEYHYNNEADGAKRGVIYIYPKAVITELDTDQS